MSHRPKCSECGAVDGSTGIRVGNNGNVFLLSCLPVGAVMHGETGLEKVVKARVGPDGLCGHCRTMKERQKK